MGVWDYSESAALLGNCTCQIGDKKEASTLPPLCLPACLKKSVQIAASSFGKLPNAELREQSPFHFRFTPKFRCLLLVSFDGWVQVDRDALRIRPSQPTELQSVSTPDR